MDVIPPSGLMPIKLGVWQWQTEGHVVWGLKCLHFLTNVAAGALRPRCSHDAGGASQSVFSVLARQSDIPLFAVLPGWAFLAIPPSGSLRTRVAVGSLCS